MSVWKAPVYRDAPLQAAARVFGINRDSITFLRKLCDFTVEDFGDFPVPQGLAPGNLQQQLPRDDVAAIRFLRTLVPHYGGSRLARVCEQFARYDTVHFGLAAVYRFYRHIALKHRDATPLDLADQRFIREAFVTGTILGKHTPKDSNNKIQEYLNSFVKHGKAYLDAFTAYVRVANAYNSRVMKEAILDWRNNGGELQSPGFKEARKLRVRNLLPFNGMLTFTIGDDLYVLTKDDLARVERLLQGTAYYKTHLATYGRLTAEQRVQLLRAHDEYFGILLDAIPRLTHDTAQWLCRACDVAYHMRLAAYAADLDQSALDDQKAKVRKENLMSIVDVYGLANAASDLPIREVCEVMLFHKILPQPDFDYFGAAKRQQELYALKNDITDEAVFRSVLRHHKLLMIQAYHSRHGVCPGTLQAQGDLPAWARNYPYVDPARIPAADVDIINMTGAFVYVAHPLDHWDLVKDKSICPKNIADVRSVRDLERLPKTAKNQLLYELTLPAPRSVDHIVDRWEEAFMDIKCEDKPEAKKPHGRWFMEAHSEPRLVLSEYELSVAEYGKHLEGFMQGKGLIEKQKMMNHVTEVLPEVAGHSQVFISFDIAKFSPRLPIRVHEELDKQWADAFGKPHIERMSDIFTKGNLHYVKGMIHHQFPKPNADFEGFAGRKLTFYHLAVMHAFVEIAKARGSIKGTARYAAQIDDGVMRVAADVSSGHDFVSALRAELEAHWLACGMEISWDKTFISKHFAVFLNDIRYHNRAIQPATRAVVKLTAKADTPVPSFPDDIAIAESTVRGCIASGTPILEAYFFYVLLVHGCLLRWAKKPVAFADRHIAWAFAPVGLGGVGMQNALSMMGSLDHSAFETGVGNLYLMGKIFPRTANIVNEILNQPIRELSDLDMVVNPLAIRREGRIFRNDRLIVAARRAITFWFGSTVLEQSHLVLGAEAAMVQVPHVANATRMPVELRELWYASTPLKVMDTIARKILTSRTALHLIPKRALFRMAIANQTEAQALILSW